MRNVLLSEKELEYIQDRSEKKPFERGYNQTYIKRALLEKIDNLDEIVTNFVIDLSILQRFSKVIKRMPEDADIRNLLISVSLGLITKDENIDKQTIERYKNKDYEKEKAKERIIYEMQKNNIVKLTPQILSEKYNISPKRASKGLNQCVKRGIMKKVKKGVYELILP